MKKRIKHKAVGRAPQAKQSVSNVVPEKNEVQSEENVVQSKKTEAQSEKPQEIHFPLRAEYILQQYYDIIVDERLIEEEWASQFDAKYDVQEDVERFKRMLRAIVADREVLREVFDYLVLSEMESGVGGSYSYEYYDGRKEFISILVERVHLFIPEDKAWLLSLWNHKGEKDFDLD